MWKLLGSTQIAPGKTVRHGYWWGGPSKGPQMALACPNTKIETWSNHVNTVRQGFRNDFDCVYTVDVSCEDVTGSGGFGVYEVWVQGWS